jgi:hypothetical protein
MSQHTPGPWYWTAPNYEGVCIIGTDGPRHKAIANVYDGEPDYAAYRAAGHDSERYAREAMRAETKSNARLIAAAPELLAALEYALNWLASYPGHGADSAYDKARAAIAKAEGGA